MKRTILLLLAFASLSVSARQDPPSPPVHEPKACTRPENPRKGYVPCAKCKMSCDKDGHREEDNACKAWCNMRICACFPPCCPE